MTETEIRQSIIDACRRMNDTGLNQGTSGNISIRHGDTMLITPSATPYDGMTPFDIAAMPIDGDYGGVGRAAQALGRVEVPSRYPARPPGDRRGRALPLHLRNRARHRAQADTRLPLHDRGVRRRRHPLLGLRKIRNARIVGRGVAALDGRLGCLLANHGMIAIGPSLDRAMWLAVELETIARQYHHSLLIGGPVILSDAEIAQALGDFAGYGPQPRRGPDAGA